MSSAKKTLPTPVGTQLTIFFKAIRNRGTLSTPPSGTPTSWGYEDQVSRTALVDHPVKEQLIDLHTKLLAGHNKLQLSEIDLGHIKENVSSKMDYLVQ